jgi:hypothetical protein
MWRKLATEISVKKYNLLKILIFLNFLISYKSEFFYLSAMRKFFILFLGLTPAYAENVPSRFFFEAAAGFGRMYTSVRGYNLADVESTNTLIFPTGNGVIPDAYFRNMSSEWGNSAAMGMLSLGFDYRPDPEAAFVMGLKVGGGYSNMCTQSTYSLANTNSTVPVSSDRNVYLSEKGFFLAAVRLGGIVDHVWMPFAELGWAARHIKIQYGRLGAYMPPGQIYSVPVSGNTQGQQSQSIYNWISGPLLGIGLEYNFSPCFVIGVVCEVILGLRKTMAFSKNLYTTGNGTFDAPVMKVAPLVTQFLLTLKYALPTK